MAETGANSQVSSAALNEISYYESRKNEYGAKLENLSEDIRELERFAAALAKMQTGFLERQQARLNALTAIFLVPGYIKMAAIYAIGMRELLSGSEAQDISGGINTACRTVKNKIDEVHEEMNTCRREISRCEEEISYWYGKLT